MKKHAPLMAAAGAVVALAAAAVARATPFVPASDDLVLERVPVRDDAATAARAALAANPTDLDLAVTVARAYVVQGRKEADPRYYGRAQAVLAPWWDEPAPPVPVLSLRAQVRQSKHDFDGALADLNAVLERSPHDADAYFSRAVIYEVRGEPQRALENCAPLWRLADALSTTACLASAASLNGRAQQSYHLLEPMMARAGDADPETRAWAYTVLAEIAERTGRDDVAEAQYRAALAAAEPNQYRLGAYADFLLDRGRNAEVRTLLADSARMDPLLLRIGIASRHLHADDAPAISEDLGERFAALRARNDTSHMGNEARYALALKDDPARALELALKNFAVQREPIDLRILLEAALAARRPAAAKEALDWYAQSGLEDVRIAALAGRLGEGAP